MTARPDHAADVDVVVGIVTHRRPASLQTLLERLAVLRFPGRAAPSISVVVVDNSPDLEGRAVVDRASASGLVPVDYVPLGAGNIASGRNEVLRVAGGQAPLIALIDDDELPDIEWLHQLLVARHRTAADVVTGPVVADYPAGAPEWLSRSGFHSMAGPSTGRWVDEAYTCNVLVSRDLVRRLALRFDEALGVSGGEDQLFFRQAREGGARMYFEPAAVVREPVAPQRLSLGYLIRREYRKGSTLGLLDRSRSGWPAGHPLPRLARAGWWAASGALAAVGSPVRADRAGTVAGLMRMARAAGMLYGLLGRTYELYAPPAAAPQRRPVMAVVAAEGPGYQLAGHSRHLQGFVSHYRSAGYDVVVVVPGGRTGFLVRRADLGDVTYRAPSLRTIGRWQVMTAPRAIGMQLAWATFRRLPLGAQRAVDRIRTARRSRQQTDHVLGTWMTPATSQWVARTLERLRPEAVLFNTVFMVPDSLTLPPSVRFRAVISHDVVHERAENFRAAGHRVHPADFSAEQEADRLATVGTVVAIQWDDARSLAALAPRARVVVSPVVVDAVPAPADARVPQRCLFVGSGSLHNVEALTWFLRECWPTVVRRRPGSELHVVGTVCARVGGVPEGVVLRGEVDSLAEEYGQAAVVVAPLRTGSGLKVKVVEAMCHGVATVTTSVGAQGLGGVWPRPYRLADTAEGFAHEVITLLTDDVARQQVEAAALSAAPLFSAAEAYAEIDQLLVEAEIVPPGRRTEEPACVPVR